MGQMHKLDREAMRQNNLHLIFESVYRMKECTKSQLAAATGMSTMAVGRITDLLLELGLLVEAKQEENAGLGRPAMLLAINREDIVSVGVALDMDGARIGMVGPYGQLHAQDSIPFAGDAPEPHAALQATARMIDAFLQRHRRSVPAIGVSMPGLIDCERGFLRLASQLHWREVPVVALLEKHPGLPRVLLDNDVKAQAQAETRFGKSRGQPRSVLLNIGSGIGAGVIIGGEIYRGKGNMAGELGHTALNLNSRMCECGRMGCLQATVSEPALMREVRAVHPGMGMQGLEAAYRNRESWACTLLDMTAEHILMIINLLANTYAPDSIILCGSLIDHCEVLRENISQACMDFSSFFNHHFTLNFSDLGENGKVIGAATVAFNHMLRERIGGAGAAPLC